MITIDVQEMQNNFQGYVKQVQGGESLLLLQGGKPIAEIKPWPGHDSSPRPFGLCAGQFTVPDDFDAPLPEDILQEFEGR